MGTITVKTAQPNPNGAPLERLKKAFEHDCMYFNTATQMCEKIGGRCYKGRAIYCKSNTAPIHLKTKTTKSTKTVKPKIKELNKINVCHPPFNKTFIDALYSGNLGKIVFMNLSEEMKMKDTVNLVKKALKLSGNNYSYDFTSIKEIKNDYDETISVGDIIEFNNSRWYVLQFANNNRVILMNRKCLFQLMKIKTFKKCKKIDY